MFFLDVYCFDDFTMDSIKKGQAIIIGRPTYISRLHSNSID